jgi:hypothetical protein
LGSLAKPEGEEVKKLPGVHCDDKVGFTCIRQDVARIFLGNSKCYEPSIGFMGLLKRLAKTGKGFGNRANGMGNDKLRLFRTNVTLALLAETRNSMPHQLVGTGATDSVHCKDKRGMLKG